MADKVIPTDIPSKANPTDSDILIISDVSDNNELKQITIGSITADIADWIVVDGSASTTTTYSSDKINTLNGTQDTALTNAILGINTALGTKLNKAGQLRTWNGAWKTTYNDASGNEVELALGASGYVLSSNGASAAPSWVSLGVPDASTTVKWIVELATDAEALARTDETRYVNAKQLRSENNRLWFAGTRNINEASATVTYTHSLWYIPTLIEVHWQYTESTTYGFWSNWNQYALSYNWVSTTTFVRIWDNTRYNIWTIQNITATTFDIAWVLTGSGVSNVWNLLFTVA